MNHWLRLLLMDCIFIIVIWIILRNSKATRIVKFSFTSSIITMTFIFMFTTVLIWIRTYLVIFDLIISIVIIGWRILPIRWLQFAYRSNLLKSFPFSKSLKMNYTTCWQRQWSLEILLLLVTRQIINLIDTGIFIWEAI